MSPTPHASGPASGDTDNRARSEFLLRLCHDLRSSLRSIQPHTEMLAKVGQSGTAEDFEQRIGFVLDGTRRLDALLSELAGYAIALQIDAGSFRKTGLDGVLRNALMLLEKESAGISGKVSSGSLPRVEGDADRLRQVFEILIRNAMDRATGDWHVEIGAEPHGEGWLISVRDDAGAFDAGDLETMFRPLERLNRRNGRDMGLGLATCRVIVERHGGRIWAESDGGTGATFQFTLPKLGES